MGKLRKNDTPPAPGRKSGMKGKRDVEDDIDRTAKKQKTAREKAVLVDDHVKVKKKLPPKKAKTPASSSAATPLPNSLFVSNLSGDVTKKRLKKFFKDEGAGSIIGIEFDTFDDGSSKGFARVQFATSEAVHQALMLNGRPLEGQHVKLNYGHEQLKINLDSSSFTKPADFSENTVLIKGFDSAYDEILMQNFLEDHFATYGDEITKTLIMKDKVSGASAGVAFMEFGGPNCMPEVLEQNGTVLRGFTLQVEKAKHVEGAEPSGIVPVSATKTTATVPIVRCRTPSTGTKITSSDNDD